MALLLALMILTSFRLTWLIARDDFPPVMWARTKIYLKGATWDPAEKEYRPRWWGELVTCTWCASGWVSLGVTGTIWAMEGLPLPLLWWFAVWGGAAAVCAYLAKP